MKNETLKLGQAGERIEDGVWLFIAFRSGQYLTWSEAEDKEFRELMDINTKAKLPRIKIRRFHHPSRNSFVRKALQRYRRVGNIPAELEQKIIRESVANETLEDWELIALKDGTVPEYSPEMGMQAFKEDPEFYEAIIQAGLNEEYHRATSLQEDSDALGEI